MAVLLIATPGVDHQAGRVVHRQQQRERRSLISQPQLMTAVQLDQHTLPGHPLTAYPVLGRSSAARTAQSGVDQDAPQSSPPDVDYLAFALQLAQMGVVGASIPSTGQTHHIGDRRLSPNPPTR